MPHLTFWNRYWKVAGDEFSIPAFCSILARLFWTLLITIVFTITFNSLAGCSQGWIFLTYLIFSIAIFIAMIVCDIGLLFVSLKGTICETEQRSNLGFYLNIKIFLGALQFLCAIFGLISLTAHSEVPCNTTFEDSGVTRAFVTIVVVSQLLDVTSLLCCCYLLAANKVNEHHREQEPEPEDPSWALNTWESRCRAVMRRVQLCTCNLFGGSNMTEGFDEVAKVLTDFFHHDGFLDVVPSDVVAGIVLVRIEQRTLRRMVSMAAEGDKEVASALQGSLQGAHIEITADAATVRRSEHSSGRQAAARIKDNLYQDLGADDADVDVDAAERGAVQRRQLLTSKSYVSSSFGPRRLYGTDPIDLRTLEEMSRMSVYALGIYTHLIVIYMRPCTGLCQVCFGAGANICSNGCTCCAPGHKLQTLRREGRSVVEGDNWCGLNHTGLSVVTEQLQNSELAYVSFTNDIVRKVYAVFLDHEKQQVVIAVRGTLSLEDCITDVICDPVPLDAVGEQYGFEGKGRFAHGGMLKSAMGIRAELDAHDTLGRIFSGVDTTLNTPLRERGSCAHYRLVVTGHSLGAGTAVLLAIILRKSYPNLHCYAFGTPGSVVDPQTARECAEYVTTVVLGNDLVSRLSYRALSKLRNDVLDAISRARVNKMMIMQAIFKEFDASDLMYPPGEEPDTPFKRSITEFKALMRQRLEKQQIHLYMPGRIIHLDKITKGTRACFRTSPKYRLREARSEDFEDILLSTTMASDHMPDLYYYEIKKLLDERLNHMTV